MKAVFALVDCNNFFVSCERIFRPDLVGKPVVVLSSNDGCAVSRSNEAKALGIPMGAPAFKYRELFRRQGVVTLSANFELYGDISHRITRLLTGVTPRTEAYSVDESFLDLSELSINDYQSWGRGLRERVLREVGVPVSVGIAPSKTLAKLASERAKKDPLHGGALDLYSLSHQERLPYLMQTPVEDIWGIGRRLAPKVKAEGIFTAAQLALARPQLAKQLMGIHGRQLVAELNGTCCHPLQLETSAHKTVMNGRTFGEDTAEQHVLEAAVASLTARAARRLRHDNLLARGAVLSLSTSRFKPGYQRIDQFVNFAVPTADTGEIASSLRAALDAVFTPTLAYHRANVLLFDLVPADSLQLDLLGQAAEPGYASRQTRSHVVDELNARFRPGVIKYAAENLSAVWQPKKALSSPRYTTDWQELPVARILK